MTGIATAPRARGVVLRADVFTASCFTGVQSITPRPSDLVPTDTPIGV
jgi:hypothetical protein